MKTELGPHGHGRYYIIDENRRYPSVTTILGEMSDKSWVNTWKERVGKDKADNISKNSAERGTFMHKLCENYLNLSFNESDNNNILKKTFNITLEDPEISSISNQNKENGKNLFLKFLNSKSFDRIDKVISQEEALWSSRGGGYAGRCDFIAIVDGVLKVIDFKSSTKPKKEKWIDGYKMQISAYAVAYYDMFGELPKGYEIMISNEITQTPQIFKGNQRDIKDHFTNFLKMVVAYHKKYSK